MERAEKVPTDELARITTRVIDQLLADRPPDLHDSTFTGNTSQTITGVRGIRVFFFTDTSRGSRSINLQVNGPERLIKVLVSRYQRYDPWGRSNGCVVFHITD